MKLQLSAIIFFVRKNFGPIIFILLAANCIIISFMLTQQDLTITTEAPYGTTSLQFNRSNSNVQPIISSWVKRVDSTSRQKINAGRIVPDCTNGFEVAIRQTWQDFIFILLYSLTGAVLLITLLTAKGHDKNGITYTNIPLLKVALLLLAIAAAMDVTENIFMLCTMKGGSAGWYLIFFPAIIKTGILIALQLLLLLRALKLNYIQGLPVVFSGLLVSFANILVKFRIVVICQLALFLIIWLADQGRDLLLIINSRPYGVFSFAFSITVLALLNWYFPKYYEFIEPKKPGKPSDTPVGFFQFFLGLYHFPSRMEKNKIDTARILGALTLLIAATGILHAMRIFKIPYLLQEVNPLLILILITVFYGIVLNRGWIDAIFRPKDTIISSRVWILGIIILAVIIYPLFDRSEKPQFLAWLSLDLFLGSFAFLVFASLRTCVDKSKPVLGWNITPLVTVAGLVFFLFFLIANLRPEWVFFSESLRLFTLPVVVSAIIFYVFLFTYLLILGRNTGIRIITILFLAGLIISAAHKTTLHNVRSVDRDKRYAAEDSLNHYAYEWLAARTAEIRSFRTQQGRPYPVFVINAYGGGIRAAAWTALVIDTLQVGLRGSNLLDRNFSSDFQHYVFSYSGASGGTIGASVLCASRYRSLETGTADALDHEWKPIFKKDYLTPVLTALLGRDIWNSIFGQHFGRDRAAIQEDLWQSQLSGYGIDYSKPLAHYWNNPAIRKYEIPLLFANTYNVDSGLKGITAPVLLNPDNFPGSIFIQDLVRKNPGTTLKLSTASFLSARFPIISPTGKFDDEHHFMDGGFKENSGAETSHQILAVLDAAWKKLAKDSTLDSDMIQLQVFSIPNGVQAIDSIQKAKNLFELTAPLTALENNWIGNTTAAEIIHRVDTARYHYRYISIRPKNLAVNDFFPVLPLGWQISDEALEQMLASLRKEDKEIQEILAAFGRGHP